MDSPTRPATAYPNDSVQYLTGIGPRRAAALAELGIRTLEDLISYVPARYEAHAGPVAIADLTEGVLATVCGRVVSVGGRYPTFTCEIDDGTGRCGLRWFDRSGGRRGISVGATVQAQGKPRVYRQQLELSHPRVRVFQTDTTPESPDTSAGLQARYVGSDHIAQAHLRAAISTALERLDPRDVEFLPTNLLERRDLPTRLDALRHLHQPSSDSEIDAARRRLAYEELLLWQIALLTRRGRQRRLRTQAVHSSTEIDRRIRARLPFTLTGAQDRAIADIVADLSQAQPMRRLLQGDVGSGKTAVAVYAALTAIARQHQVALLAPTEVLARQHAAKLRHYLTDSRVTIDLLLGSQTAGERRDTLERIERGTAHLVVGTHALLEPTVRFRNLALAIIDEQHKFGVSQRATLLERRDGHAVHLLAMSATPIPRSLALTLFGDLDVSVIDELPAGRGTLRTRLVPQAQRANFYRELCAELRADAQAYIVCPAIDVSDAGYENVTQRFAALTAGPLREISCDVLHGRMSSDEKAQVIDRFRAGQLRALVATTVVEVGLDVPDATHMVIEDAHRFGLAQLHQLRGRVGRGSRPALCTLIFDPRARTALERLSVLESTRDGFEIAEADLRQRGPGEFLGTQQSGLPEWRFADLSTHADLLLAARDDTQALFRADPSLSALDNRPLRAAAERRFGATRRHLGA